MPSKVSLSEVQAWLEPTKLTLATIDTALEGQVSTQIFARVSGEFLHTDLWVDSTTTPVIIRSIIAMTYAAWIIDKSYSQDAVATNLATQLRKWAGDLLDGIVSGIVDVVELTITSDAMGNPSWEPRDNTLDDNGNLIQPVFTMGVIW